MNRPLKISLAIVLLIILVLAGVLVAAKLLVTPERIRATVVPLAEKSLQRKIDIGSIEVGLFSGVSLDHLKIYDRQGREPFIAAERGVLKYRFWPLLLGRVVVDQVLLVAPTMTLERFADGSLNLGSAAAPPKGPPAEAVAPAARPAAKPAASSIDLLVTSVEVQNGSLLFIDHQLNPQAPFRYQLDKLNLQARDVSLQKEFPVTLTAQINGAPLSLDGNLDLAGKTSDLQLEIKQLDLTPFAPYLRDRLPGVLSHAVLDTQIEVKASPTAIAAKGKLGLDQLHLVLDALKQAPIRDSRLNSSFDMAYHPSKADLQIDALTLGFNQITVKLKGALSRMQTNPTADLNITIDPVGIRAVLDSLPPELSKSMAGLDPAGTVHGDLQLRGPLNRPLELLQQGDLGVSGLQANLGSFRPSLDGRFMLSSDRLQSEGVELSLGDQRASLELQVSPVLEGRPQVHGNLQAKQLALDALLSGRPATPAPAQAPVQGAPASPVPPVPAASAAKPAVKELAPIALPFDAEGEIRIASATYHGLELSDLAIDYRLLKNVLNLNRISGKLADGSLTQTARVDLGKPGLVYQSDLQLTNVQAGPLVKAFAPDFKGAVSGGINLQSSLSGQGTVWEKLRNRLTGKGSLQIDQCTISDAPLAAALAAYLQLGELRQLVFDQVKGTFNVAKGQLQLDAKLNGSQLALQPQGTIGLDGGLKLSLPTRLSPELAKRIDRRGQFSGLLADQDGGVTLPLKLGGALDSPEFGLDAKQLRKQVINQAGKKLEERLLKKLAPDKGQDQPADAKRKLLENTLRGLFGQ